MLAIKIPDACKLIYRYPYNRSTNVDDCDKNIYFPAYTVLNCLNNIKNGDKYEIKVEGLKPIDKVNIFSRGILSNTKSGSSSSSSSSHGNKQTFLGYDKSLGIWYTSEEDPELFHKKIKDLTAVPGSQFKKESSGIYTSFPENAQNRCLEVLRAYCFVPPFFAQQAMDPEAFVELPRKNIQVRAKNLDGVKIDGTLSTFFEGLLTDNNGIFLGHSHELLERGLTDSLINLMPTLSKMGVKHFYDEMDAYTNYIEYLRFNKAQKTDKGKDLRDHLLKIGIEKTEVDEKMRIYKAAREHGIEVWPIDCSNEGIADRYKDVRKRLKLGNGGMIRNIDYFSSKLKEGEKFVTLNGAGHYQIANDLGIPNVLFILSMSEFMFAIAKDPKTVQINPNASDNVKVNLNYTKQISYEEFCKIHRSSDFYISLHPEVEPNQTQIYKDLSDNNAPATVIPSQISHEVQSQMSTMAGLEIKNNQPDDYYSKGVALYHEKNYVHALAHIIISLAIYREANDQPLKIAVCLSTIASCCRDMGELKRAAEACNEALELLTLKGLQTSQEAANIRKKLDSILQKMSAETAQQSNPPIETLIVQGNLEEQTVVPSNEDPQDNQHVNTLVATPRTLFTPRNLLIGAGIATVAAVATPYFSRFILGSDDK